MADCAPIVAYASLRLPLFLVPSAIVCFSLTVLSRFYLSAPIPKGVIIVATVCARPVLFFAKRWLKPFLDARAARAADAVLPPRLKDTGIQRVLKMRNNLKNAYPGELTQKTEAEYGTTWIFTVISEDILSTTEPEHIKTILATQADQFEKGSTFRYQLHSLLGTGIFNADGELWKFHRSMTRPFFTRERISDFEIYERNSTQSLQVARQRLNEGYSIDFQDLVSRFTLDSATEFLFGVNVNSLSASLAYPPSSGKPNPPSFATHNNDFVHAFGKALSLAALRTGLGADWPLAEPLSDHVAPFRKVIDAFVQPVIDKVINDSLNSEDTKTGDASTLLEYLVSQTRDPSIIKDELVNLLVAGRDTTASLMTFSLYVLSRHPEIEARLREEIFEKVGRNSSPTYDQMRGMKYMRAFLNEVLRVYPPVPFNSRRNIEPVIFTTKDPNAPRYYIPKGTTCLYSMLIMHRRKDLWGPDADIFDPDRFLDERLHKYLTPNPFIFLPFSAGPRICLGQQFAYHEATFFLTRLLQHFTSFQLDTQNNTPIPPGWASQEGFQGSETIRPRVSLTLFVDGGLWLNMKEYNAS